MPVLTDSISIDQQEAAGHATDLTSTDAKVSSESLLFNKEIDDDGHQQIDAFTRQLLTALEISVIFEDLVDTMTAISNAVPAPVVEIRTAASIVEDEFFNRPRYGGFVKEVAQTVSKVPPTTPFTTGAAKPLLPPIVKRDSKSLGSPESKSKVSKDKQSGTGTTVSNKSRPMSTAGSQSESQTEFVGKEHQHAIRWSDVTLVPLSESTESSHEVEEIEQDPEMRGYLLRQFYMPKVIKRVWQSNKETPTRPLEEMMKNAGLKRSNARHKLQGDIGLIKSMMADIFNELVQKGTWHSLNNHLTEEREELLKLSKANQRLMGMRAYSKELRGEINETKQSKKRELHALKSLEHQIENDGQELCVRTEIEAAYTQHMVAAKIEESKKASEIAPRATEEEMERVKKWMFIEDRAHENIRMFLLLCLEKVSSLLDYWIEKYEVDKERLMADLEELKDERAATAAHRERLEAKIKLWMPIIKDNRRIVKRREDEKRYLQKCAYYATKVAARWRGYMVRAGVGRFGSMFA